MPKVLKHSLGWLGFALFLFAVIAGLSNSNIAALKVPVMMLGVMLAFYINSEWLLPRYYAHKKMMIFLGLNLLILGILTVACVILTGFLVHSGIFGAEVLADGPPRLRPPGRGPNHPPPRPPRRLIHQLAHVERLFTNAMPAIFGLLLSLVDFNQSSRIRQEQKESETQKAEKTFLINQINPHFLFNALNNIYALNIDNSQGSKAIMQLSGMLHYSIYKGQKDVVRLEEEIDYIANYIELFKLKDDAIENIEFDYGGADSTMHIAPLLILPFVENAFKHGNVEEIEGAWIRIRIATEGKKIKFSCENTFSPHPKSKDEMGGIGIQNVRRRLELIYKDKYELEITEDSAVYRVELQIDLEGHEA